MATELKRRDLSGIYIFDTLPGDRKRKPTCVEDCTPEKRREWCMTLSKEALRETIRKEAETFTDLCDFLLSEKCLTKKNRQEFVEMIERAVERSQFNWSEHELADQVDFVCEKVVLLADACGVTKHKEEDEED